MLPLKSLTKRHFGRNVRGVNFESPIMQENPFTVSSDYLFKINKWLLEKAPEMESISFGGNLAHDYEVFLQDECPNPKFDVKSSTSRAPYKGYYDFEGM